MDDEVVDELDSSENDNAEFDEDLVQGI